MTSKNIEFKLIKSVFGENKFMKTIGIKLADGSFYPIFAEGEPKKITLELTTANDNQTTAMVDLYCSENENMDAAEYMDTLQIDNLVAHQNGEIDISFELELDSDNNLTASICDPETGERSNVSLSLNEPFLHKKQVAEKFGNGVTVNREVQPEPEVNPVADETNGEIKDEIKFDDAKIDDMDFDLPDFNSDNDLPDFNFSDDVKDIPIQDDTKKEISVEEKFVADEPQKYELQKDEPQTKEDDFDFPEFDSTLDLPDFNDLDFDTSDLDTDTSNSSTLSFDGLYDKERFEGNTSYATTTVHEKQHKTKKKSKAPVIVCVICALICLIATILLLFILPSKYNLLRQTSQVADRTVVIEQREPVYQTLPYADSYNSERVIIEELPPSRENAAQIVPTPPPPPVRRPPDILYTIKWGDTLWDISNAYYRNPCLYRRIADYNAIRNPDYIVSGGTIRLPSDWNVER